MYNPNMYRNNFYYNSPFNVARMNNNEVFYTPKKGMNMQSFVKNAEKGIDTISSIIPLAQKVTPLISSGKDFVKNIKKTFVKQKTLKKEKVEGEIVENEINNTKEKEVFSKKEETKPNNPYF